MGPTPTFPGHTVPTEGEMVMGESGGSRNSKDMGPWDASSKPTRGTEGVGEFLLRRELMTYRVATDVSYKEVAANLTW